MDATIIAQKQKDRYNRALKMVEAEAVSPNGAKGQYYVRSANGNGRYLAATSETIPPLGTCHCHDYQDFGKYYGIKCKHIQATEIYELVIETAKNYASKNCMTYSRLADRLLYDLNTGMKEPMATKVNIVFHACLRLARREEMTGPMELAQVRHSVVKTLGGIREVSEQLRDNPDNRVAQEQLRGLRATLNDLNSQESTMLAAYH